MGWKSIKTLLCLNEEELDILKNSEGFKGTNNLLIQSSLQRIYKQYNKLDLSELKKKNTIAQLQKRRSVLITQQTLSNHEKNELAEIEKPLDVEISKSIKQLITRSNTQWYEQGERNNKYFYRVLKSRQNVNSVTEIKVPILNKIYTDSKGILKQVSAFYKKLYNSMKMHLSFI